MLRKIATVLVALFGTLLVLVLLLFIALSLFDSPAYAWRIIRYGQSDIGDIAVFPERAIQNGENISTLQIAEATLPQDVTFTYKDQQHTENLEALMKRTGTRAFIVIQDDRVIYEAYFDSSRDSVNTSFSSAKSFNSALIGAAIADGYIESVNDRVIQYIPEIAGHGLDQLTIRDLLLMNSGTRYLEGDELPFYKAPFADDAITYYSPDLRTVALSVEPGDTPIGEAFRYNNYHPLLEGVILERVTGMHVAEYLQEKFWKPMGAEFPASWSLDSEESGFEKMESGINARAIDFARFGLIFLHGGFWNGVQILPEGWVRESTEPLRPDPRTWETMSQWPVYGGYYKYHWWGLNNPDGTYDFYAHGRYDQIIYVAPRKNIVIVRLGDALDPAVMWPLVIRDVVDRLHSAA